MKTKKLNPHTAITRIKQLEQMHLRISAVEDVLFNFYLDFDCCDTMKQLDKAFADGEIKDFDSLRRFFSDNTYALRKEAEQAMRSII